MVKIERKFSKADICISSFLLLLLLIVGFLSESTIYGAFVFFFFGFLSFYSRRLKDSLFLFSATYWVVTNVFKPKTSVNHLIWGVFSVFIGGICLSLPPPSESDSNFFRKMHHSAEFWIGILLVIAFNIAVGIYTARQKRKRERKGDKGNPVT